MLAACQVPEAATVPRALLNGQPFVLAAVGGASTAPVVIAAKAPAIAADTPPLASPAAGPGAESRGAPSASPTPTPTPTPVPLPVFQSVSGGSRSGGTGTTTSATPFSTPPPTPAPTPTATPSASPTSTPTPSGTPAPTATPTPTPGGGLVFTSLPAGGGAISGVVVDPPHGFAPVAGATVRVVSMTDPTREAQVETGPDGTYTVAGIALGEYQVTATRATYVGTATPFVVVLYDGAPLRVGANLVLVAP